MLDDETGTSLGQQRPFSDSELSNSEVRRPTKGARNQFGDKEEIDRQKRQAGRRFSKLKITKMNGLVFVMPSRGLSLNQGRQKRNLRR